MSWYSFFPNQGDFKISLFFSFCNPFSAAQPQPGGSYHYHRDQLRKVPLPAVTEYCLGSMCRLWRPPGRTPTVCKWLFMWSWDLYKGIPHGPEAVVGGFHLAQIGLSLHYVLTQFFKRPHLPTKSLGINKLIHLVNPFWKKT